jgi:polysaccharide biosynthesis/export protein
MLTKVNSPLAKLLTAAAFAVAIAPALSAQQQVPPPAFMGSGTPTTQNTVDPRPELHHRQRYQVQRSDTLMLNFPIATEYTQTVKVKPDGFISLAGVGELSVENMDVDQVREAVKKAYVEAKILHDPLLTVDVIEFQAPFYIVTGQVNKPGKYELREDLTATGAVAEAGGFVTNYAKHSQVVVFHKIDNDWASAKTVNLKHMLNSKNLSEDIHLQPGDIVYVPQNGLSKFKNIVPYSVPAGFYSNPQAF